MSEIKLMIQTPQVPRGSSNKFAWQTFRGTLVLTDGSHRYIIYGSSRIIQWKSGNLSTQGKRIWDRFEESAKREIADFEKNPASWLKSYKLDDSCPGVRFARSAQKILIDRETEQKRAAIYEREF